MKSKRRRCIMCGRNRTENTVGYFARECGATACYDVEGCRRHQKKIK